MSDEKEEYPEVAELLEEDIPEPGSVYPVMTVELSPDERDMIRQYTEKFQISDASIEGEDVENAYETIEGDAPQVFYIDDRKDRLDVTPELFAMLLPMLPDHQEGDFSVTVNADSFIALLEATGATVKRFDEWPTDAD